MYVVGALVLSTVIGFALVQATMSVRATTNIVVVPQTQIAGVSVGIMTDAFAQLAQQDDFVNELQASDFGGSQFAQIDKTAQIKVTSSVSSLIQIEVISTQSETSSQIVKDVVDGVGRWIAQFYPMQYQVVPMPVVVSETWLVSFWRVLALSSASLIGGFVLSGLIFAIIAFAGRSHSTRTMRGNVHRQISPFDMQSLTHKSPAIKNTTNQSNTQNLNTKINTKKQNQEVAYDFNSDLDIQKSKDLHKIDKPNLNELSNGGLFRDVSDLSLNTEEADTDDTENYMRTTYTDYDQQIAQAMNAEIGSDFSNVDNIDEGKVEVRNEVGTKAQNENLVIKSKTIDKVSKKIIKTNKDKSSKKGLNESMADKLRKIATKKVASAMPPTDLPAVALDVDKSEGGKSSASAPHPSSDDIKRRLNELLSGKA